MQRAQLSAFLACYGLTPDRVRLVAQLDCDVYRIATSDEPRRDLALRIYPATKHELAPIAVEVAWLRALAADGVHALRPLPDEQGRFIRSWCTDQEATPRHAVLLTWLHGRMHDHGLTPEQLRRIGLMTAQLHRTAVGLTQAAARRLLDDLAAFPQDPLAFDWGRGFLLGVEDALRGYLAG